MSTAKKRKTRSAGVADQPIQNARSSQPPSGTRTTYFFAFLLILAVIMLYGHSLKYPLVFDDLPFFIDANLTRLGSSFFQLDLRWFPYASFGWTYKQFGTDWFWYRLGNVALHALTSILLYIFFTRLLRATIQPQAGNPAPHWPAFFAALAFALHPVAVYGVAYLIQRSILMATLFGIAALLCYMEGLLRDKPKWFVLSALCYFLAVFSKEHSIMIPGVAAALTLLLHKPSFVLAKKVWLPFALYLVIAILVILRTKGLLGATYEYLAGDTLSQLSERQVINIEHVYGLSVITQGYLFFKYFLLWTVPYTGWMSIDIRQPFATEFLSWPQSVGFVLFLAYPVLTIKWLLKGGRLGLIGFSLLFPWILYLTELSTVRIQEPFVLYRSYLWMSGLPIVLCSCIGVAPRKFVPVLLATCCLVLAGLAWNRLDTFSDSIKIWSEAIAKNQDEQLLGTERGYLNRGNAHKDLGHIPEALADYQKSIELNPKYPQPYNNSALIYASQNNLAEALLRFNTVIELAPDYGGAYETRAAVLAKMGRYAESLTDFDRAIQLGSVKPSFFSNRAIVFSNLGKFQEALNDYDKLLSLDAKNNQVWLYRGYTLNLLNRKNEAMHSFRKSCDAGTLEACQQLH